MIRSFQKASLQGSLPPPMGSVHRAVVMGHSLSCPGTCPQLPVVPCALVLLHTFSNLLIHRADVTKPTLPKTPSAVKSTWLSFAGGDQPKAAEELTWGGVLQRVTMASGRD